jgi:3',5'-cyclic AMP phosphodiesterase CpdA
VDEAASPMDRQPSEGGALVLAQVSDIHLGREQRHVADALLKDLQETGPDVVVVSGDLTMRARSHQFAAARAYLDVLPQPVLVVPGNHDIPLHNPVRRLTSPFRHYQRHITDDLDPVLDVPGATLLGLNSMPRWRWKAAHVSPRQCALVESTFGERPAGHARVLVTHHPVLPADLSSFAGRGSLVRSVARARVDLLLAGHTHDPLVAPVVVVDGAKQHEVLSVVAGTAISDRLRGVANSYPVVTIGPRRIDVVVRQWDGEQFSPSVTTTFDRRWEQER